MAKVQHVCRSSLQLRCTQLENLLVLISDVLQFHLGTHWWNEEQRPRSFLVGFLHSRSNARIGSFTIDPNTNTQVPRRAHKLYQPCREQIQLSTLQASTRLAQERLLVSSGPRVVAHASPETSSNSVGCSARSMASCRKTAFARHLSGRVGTLNVTGKNVLSHAVLQTDLLSSSCSSAARMHAFHISSVWRRVSR